MKIKNFIKRILGIEQKETIIEAQKQIIRDAHEYRVVKKDWQERELLLKNLNILKEKAKVKNGKNHKI